MCALFCLFQNRELQIMRKLEHSNIVKLKYFFYSSGDKVSQECFNKNNDNSLYIMWHRPLPTYVTLYHKPLVKSAPDQFGFIANVETLCSEF